ncbi:MAG: mitochondrial fission ELM1 family protein [Candidatus Omnitrophica bacterium]|nr:mitochondrial fission ELM1 family protein [Candidatus Omnitrophota bacterium]
MKASFFTESILYSLARGLSASLRWVPPRWGLAFGARMGDLAHLLLPGRRRVALRNLKAAFGDAYSPAQYERILRALFRHLGMTLMEVALIPRIDRAYLEEWIQIAPGSRERLEAALSKGRGVIFVTGHFGSWELISITGAILGYPTLVLAREQGWPRLNGLLTRYRESKGCRVVRKGFPIRELIRGLEEKRIVGILSDQDGGRNGVLAPFFGRLASTAPGVIALSIHTGAPVLPVFVVRRDGPAHTLYLEEPLRIPEEGSLEERVQAGIAQYLRILEGYVRRFPAQWLWLHRRWKSSPERRVLLLTDGKPGHLAQLKAFSERLETAWAVRSRGDERLKGVRHQRPLVQVQTVRVAYRNRLCRSLLTLVAGAAPRRWPGGGLWLQLALTPESLQALQAAHADFSISCGAGTAPVNLLWAWGIGAKAVHITRTRFPSWRRFHLAVIPRHDLSGSGDPFPSAASPNLFVTDGALAPFPKSDAARLEGWRQRLRLTRERQVGLLLGGPAQGAGLELDQVQKVVEGLLEACEALDAEILVTSSRRTPVTVEEWLKRALGGHPRCRLLVLVNGKESGGLQDPQEAVPCIFGLADALVVSGDSISMVSEAMAHSKPVVSFLPNGGRRFFSTGSKYHRFLEGLSAQGRVALAPADKVGQAVRAAVIASETKPSPPNEVPRDSDPLTEFLARWL